jgi:hypothetical protein
MSTQPTIPPDDKARDAAPPLAKAHQSNVDRLLEHLDAGSLAAQLVQAHRQKSIPPENNMKPIIKARLQQVKEALEHPKA